MIRENPRTPRNQFPRTSNPSAFEVGLLLNFGPEPQFYRRVFENERKGKPLHAERLGTVQKFGGVPSL
jgi:hypothetical protein